MKHRVIKIILALQIAVYAIGVAAFLLRRLDGIHYVFEGGQVVESDSAFLKTLGHIGDTANAFFLYTVIFGWIAVLPLSIAGIVLSFFSKSWKGLTPSLVNAGISIVWVLIFISIYSSFPFEPRLKPVYNLTWHLLDDSLQGDKIILTCKNKYAEPPVEKKKNVVAGKTKKIRLPDEDFEDVEGVSKSDENVRVFVPYGFFINWREDLDKYVKQDSYEIIVYKRPEITEDEEKFVMENVPRDADFELCYWDKDARRFVHIASSDGVFYKKDRSEELLLDSEKEYPDSDEQFNLFMSVKSSVYAGETYLITLSYERDKSFLPVKNWRTYQQNGREIRTLNLELNGTQCIKTQYIDKETGKPIAHCNATIYVIFEDEERKNEEAAIETQTDENGYLLVENIPDGVALYTMFD
ncbi:hypothetical protein [Treponema zioleckii]|uniref:hypothetical protein n=1 Tax=Treponema zioleckii TaxID=331680 RepID=UPI00168B519F|nr:hypothetical protein [Treponema zioleckii]